MSSRLLPTLGLRRARMPSRHAARVRSRAGTRDHLAGVVALRGDVTDLGQRDEPLIGRVVVGHARGTGRCPRRDGQAGAVEVLQPPQIQALPGQRVHVADRPVLRHAAVWRGRNVSCRTCEPSAADHRHGHPAPTGQRWGARRGSVAQRRRTVRRRRSARPARTDRCRRRGSPASGPAHASTAPQRCRQPLRSSPSIRDAAAFRPTRKLPVTNWPTVVSKVLTSSSARIS